MRKFLSTAAVAAAALGVLAAPAHAADQACGAMVVAAGPVYLAQDTDGSVNLWIYLEDNGVDGLQRGGATIDGYPDSCQEGAANPDLLIF